MILSNHEPGPIEHSQKPWRRLAAAAVASVLALSFSEAHAETNVLSTTITVHARVLERTSMQLVSQVPELIITKADIVRGYAEVQAGSRINVKTNNTAGYLLAFEKTYDSDFLFSAVAIQIGGRGIQLSGNGWFQQPFVKGGVTQNISYRFLLSREAQPGTYPWPLSISVLPLGGR